MIAFGNLHRYGAIAAVLFALSACGPADSGSSDDAVRVAFSDAMDSLDPIMNIDSRVMLLSLFDSLTQIVPDGGLAPQLARSWAANDDATVWTFEIRTDAKWSDGTPVTIDDVMFTFKTTLETAMSPNKPYLAFVKSIDRVSDTEIRFTLMQPFASWPRQVSLIPIAPEKAYRAIGPTGFAERPVGSGPYRVTSWRRGGPLELIANPDYWGGAPEIGKVVYIPVADGVARFNGLQSGDLDIILLTPQQVELAKTRAGIEVVTAPSNKVVYLGMNVANPVLENTQLRHALDAAIDREAITKYLLRGLALPTGQLMAKVSFGYDPALGPTAYDPARAKRLIAESGYAGAPIAFEYPTDGAIPLSGQVAQAVEGYWKAAGLNIQMHGMDQHSLIVDWLGKKMDGLYMFSYNPSTLDAALVTGSLFGSAGVGYQTDPSIDALEIRQQAQGDLDRKATLAALWRRNQEQAYYLPLFNDTNSYGVVRSKLAFSPRADGYIVAQDLHRPRP